MTDQRRRTGVGVPIVSGKYAVSSSGWIRPADVSPAGVKIPPDMAGMMRFRFPSRTDRILVEVLDGRACVHAVRVDDRVVWQREDSPRLDDSGWLILDPPALPGQFLVVEANGALDKAIPLRLIAWMYDDQSCRIVGEAGGYSPRISGLREFLATRRSGGIAWR